PTKTMVASARAAYLARRAADYGVLTGPITVDQSIVRRRKRDIVESFRSSSERHIIASGAELIAGEAAFTGHKTLAVRLADGPARLLTAETIIINAGARPALPDLPGLRDVPALDSTSIMELDVVPRHLIALGGGYVGLEFGQMFRRFGSQVTVVQRRPQLLAREDDDVADAVASILREDGLELLLHTTPLRTAPAPGGGVTLSVRTPQGERTIHGSHLLVAV